MTSNSALKEQGKMAFKANYWNCVIACLILAAVTGGSTASVNNKQTKEAATNALKDLSPEQIKILIAAVIGASVVLLLISVAFKVFVGNPLRVGCIQFFKVNIQSGGSATLFPLKEGFTDFARTFITLFLADLIVFVLSLFCIIPGIIAGYALTLVPYILKDEPGLSPVDVLKRSNELMKGNKGRAFSLDISFLGWFILSAITCGIVHVFYVNPWYQNTKAAFYYDIVGGGVNNNNYNNFGGGNPNDPYGSQGYNNFNGGNNF